MEISVIIPIYNERENIQELYFELKDILDNLKKSYEIIFIDDGSSDRSFEVLEKIRNDKNLKAIQFTRHFGKSAALSIGFKYAKGDYVITMDGDLQDDPKEIPNFLNEIQKGNNDVIVGWKTIRKDPLTKKLPSKIFNKMTSLLTGIKIHDFNCCYKIYKKEVVKNINVYGELHRYLPVLACWNGYSIGEMKVHHRQRRYGKSKYGIMRLIYGFLDLITVKFLMSYSKRPFHLFGIIGSSFTFIGFIIGLYLFYLKFIKNELIGGRPLLFFSMLIILLGVQFFSMGLISEIIISTKKTDYNIKKWK